MRVLDERFEFQGILHETKWSAVHIARDLELARNVQVREISRHAWSDSLDVKQYLAATFALAELNHPNAEQFVSHRRGEDNSIFVLTDAPRSVSLGRLLRHFQEIDFPPELSLYVISQVAHLLASTHGLRDHVSGRALRLYHLGLNPETIHLTESGNVRVVDFVLPTSGEIRTADRVAYLAPELIQGTPVDQHSDLFSLGVVAYELITGERLFPQHNVSELMAEIVRGTYDLSPLGPRVSKETIALLDGCLKLRKEQRIDSAAEFAERIDRLLRDRLSAPDKTIREVVDKFAAVPKLQSYSEKERQIVRTRAFTRAELEEGTKSMSDQTPSDSQGGRRDRPGQETRISKTPYGERLKRAKRGGFGGSRTVLVLSIVAMFLFVAVVAITIKKVTQKSGGSAISTTASEMKTGKLATVPEGAEVYAGDSLLGVTPLTFSAKEGGKLTLKSKCCPDTQLAVNFEQFEKAPIHLKALVEINSTPVGAKITVNGKEISETTPYRFAASPTDTLQVTLEIQSKPVLSSGTINLADISSFSATGYEVAQLSGNVIQISGSFSEKPKTQVVTVPEGATVIIAGSATEIGTTPMKSDFGDAATMLTLRKAGFDDASLEIPAIATRKPIYRTLLFRNVAISAQDVATGSSVNGRVKTVSYEGKSSSIGQNTPTEVRLPGVVCRVSVSADGYSDVDTSISASLNSFVVMMRPVAKKEKKEEKPAVVESSAGKGQVKIVVIDNKQVAVGGVAITAEFQPANQKQKQNVDLGKSDKDGMLTLNLNPGKYKFISNHPDYKSDDQKQEVKSGQTYVVTLKIKKK